MIDVVHIARICHEANRVLCEALGDHTLQQWYAAHQSQRDSVISGVLYRLKNLDETPAQQHEEWLRVKLEAGWTLGRVNDPHVKTHPNIRPYSELPPEQRAKDHLFAAIVRSMVEAGIAE